MLIRYFLRHLRLMPPAHDLMPPMLSPLMISCRFMPAEQWHAAISLPPLRHKELRRAAAYFSKIYRDGNIDYFSPLYWLLYYFMIRCRPFAAFSRFMPLRKALIC